MSDQTGPDSEQLDTPEDVERLADIGDLIASGAASYADFKLSKFELIFLRGYIEGARR